MAVQYVTPGVYIQEIPSGVHPITGVSTSNTAFVDWFPRGPVDRAVRISSWADFERTFGGFDSRSEASYAIHQYFMNGGGVAFVVRSADSAASAATHSFASGAGGDLKVSAASPGTWGKNLQVAIDDTNVKGGDTNLFNLVVREVATVNGRTTTVRTEVFRNLSWQAGSSFAVDVVNNGSAMVQISNEGLAGRPDATSTGDPINNPQDADFQQLDGDGAEGATPADAGWTYQMLEGAAGGPTGIYTLDAIAPEIFNILCIPATARLSNANAASLIADATTFCSRHRAMFIVDLPQSLDTASGYQATFDAMYKSGSATAFVQNVVDNARNANLAVYFPRLSIPDPTNGNRPRMVGASGTVAGIWARTDAQRGVWKAPAGTEATIAGASLAVNLTDSDNGVLNSVGVNVLRSFPVFGAVAWGARTLEGADIEASEWKYIPVRRMALFLEESLVQGLKWVVFEPNAEPLWAQIRLNVGAFMHDLFRKGAFAGVTPRDAYLVKCDKETTTQTDVDNGIVNIVVGFAPLKPAEFVIVQIQQLAGQIQV